MENKTRIIIIMSLLLLVIIYITTGIYSLQTGQRALIIRFGQVVKEVYESGIHYCLPRPIEKAIKVQTSKVQTVSVQEQQNDLLERFTGDENLIVVHAMISYDIKNLSDYIFKSEDVKLVLQSAGQMCLTRELTGMNVDEAMTTGKALLRLVIKEKLQKVLDEMELGIRLISVELTDISPPKGVSDAFTAVANARVKKQEIIKDAEGYANSTIPKARGEVASIISGAEAYSKEIISTAQGAVRAFEELAREYDRNPQITINQKMLETLQMIFNKCKVSIDANPSQSVYYISE